MIKYNKRKGIFEDVDDAQAAAPRRSRTQKAAAAPASETVYAAFSNTDPAAASSAAASPEAAAGAAPPAPHSGTISSRKTLKDMIFRGNRSFSIEIGRREFVFDRDGLHVFKILL